eukprot:2019459-Amphidinium_carterae.1
MDGWVCKRVGGGSDQEVVLVAVKQCMWALLARVSRVPRRPQSSAGSGETQWGGFYAECHSHVVVLAPARQNGGAL